jgi:hypothetical protein
LTMTERMTCAGVGKKGALVFRVQFADAHES